MDKNDDNRVVADMSNLDDRGIMGSWFGILHPGVRAGRNEKRDMSSGTHDSRNMGAESSDFSAEDRRALIKYTLKYSLAIGAIFLGSFALVIFLILKAWF